MIKSISRFIILSLSIIFSYKNIIILFNARFKGNCLKLSANGILNQVPCAKTFDDDCPENHYFSDKIFNCKYPLQDIFFFQGKNLNKILNDNKLTSYLPIY